MKADSRRRDGARDGREGGDARERSNAGARRRRATLLDEALHRENVALREIIVVAHGIDEFQRVHGHEL
jgi:hypothetical protein